MKNLVDKTTELDNKYSRGLITYVEYIYGLNAAIVHAISFEEVTVKQIQSWIESRT